MATCDWLRSRPPWQLGWLGRKPGQEREPRAGRGESDGWGHAECAGRHHIDAWRWEAGAKRSRSQPGPTASSQGRGERLETEARCWEETAPGHLRTRPCSRTGGAAAAVTLSGYFSIMASCPGRPLWMYWEKSAGPPPARAEEAEESGGRVCLLRRSGWGPHWEEQAQSTGLDFLLFCSRSPLPASSKETEQGPPSQSSG